MTQRSAKLDVAVQMPFEFQYRNVSCNTQACAEGEEYQSCPTSHPYAFNSGQKCCDQPPQFGTVCKTTGIDCEDSGRKRCYSIPQCESDTDCDTNAKCKDTKVCECNALYKGVGGPG